MFSVRAEELLMGEPRNERYIATKLIEFHIHVMSCHVIPTHIVLSAIFWWSNGTRRPLMVVTWIHFMLVTRLSIYLCWEAESPQEGPQRERSFLGTHDQPEFSTDSLPYKRKSPLTIWYPLHSNGLIMATPLLLPGLHIIPISDIRCVEAERNYSLKFREAEIFMRKKMKIKMVT